jgi:hypothetical protein
MTSRTATVPAAGEADASAICGSVRGWVSCGASSAAEPAKRAANAMTDNPSLLRLRVNPPVKCRIMIASSHLAGWLDLPHSRRNGTAA